jgi:hypothetical protein
MSQLSHFSGLEEALESYLDGMHACSVSKLGSVFDDGAHLQSLNTSGGVSVEAKSDWLKRVAERVSPASRGEPRNEKIESLVLVSPSMAHATLQVQMGPVRFQDVLVFLRSNKKWSVVSKTFRIMDP